MIDTLRNLLGFARRPDKASLEHPPAGTGRITFDARTLDLIAAARWHEDIPHPQWEAVHDWMDALSEERRGEAWQACERAWLDWLRGSLGLHYRLYESDRALLLTTQTQRLADVKLGYLGTTFKRITRVLEELADGGSVGKEILIACANEDDYYRYVSGFYPSEGEFAMSSGMHLNHGRGHFVTNGSELHDIEPVIVHEMTHSCLSHLRIPAWLNEGMAVTIERLFADRPRDPYLEQELHRKHRAFWTPDSIQEFWAGSSYLRPDEGNELSYALGRILVDGLSDDWPAFKAFALEAEMADAGAESAARHLHVDLGEFVRHFLEATEGTWGPMPARWPGSPERGAFRFR